MLMLLRQQDLHPLEIPGIVSPEQSQEKCCSRGNVGLEKHILPAGNWGGQRE